MYTIIKFEITFFYYTETIVYLTVTEFMLILINVFILFQMKELKFYTPILIVKLILFIKFIIV